MSVAQQAYIKVHMSGSNIWKGMVAGVVQSNKGGGDAPQKLQAGRPDLGGVLKGLKFIREKQYPIRGTLI